MKIIYEESDIQGGLRIGRIHGAFLLAVDAKERFFRVSTSTGQVFDDPRLTKKQVVELMNREDYKVWK